MTMITQTPCDEHLAEGAAEAEPCGRSLEMFVLAATILGSSMAFVDGTAVNVALPALQTDLGATAADVQWVVESYALTLAALLLVGGSLGDLYGRRRVFGVGVGLFAASSVACGLAPSVALLIAFRAIQGIGAALLVPGSLAIISASFGEERRGAAIGTWSGFTAITAALGPVLGGWLVDTASWRWVFYINVPIALAVFALLMRVPESRDDEARALDVPGAFLATAGLGGVVFGLIEASRLGVDDPIVIGSVALGLAAMIAFVVVESRSKAPMLPPGLFSSATFSGANAMTLLLYAALGGALFFLPFNLIQVQGYSATGAGAALLPFILLMFLLSRWAGDLVTKVGPRVPLIVGPLIAATGLALLATPAAANTGSYWTGVFPAVVVLGLGMAVTVAPLTTVVMSSAPVRHSGIASGVNNAVSRTGSLLAVAGFGLVMTILFGAELESRLADGDVPGETVQQLMAQRDAWAAATVESEDPAVRSAAELAVDASFVRAYRIVTGLAATLAVLAALAAATWIRDPQQDPASAPEPEPAAAGA